MKNFQKKSYIYIYTSAILHPRCRILFYTKLLYWTKFSIVQYLCFSIFQYFRILGVVINDTERCSVLLSIFLLKFDLWCRIIFYIYGVYDLTTWATCPPVPTPSPLLPFYLPHLTISLSLFEQRARGGIHGGCRIREIHDDVQQILIKSCPWSVGLVTT